MLDKERGEDRADGVQAAEEGSRDAVEAHGRDGGGGALPLLVAGEVQHRRAHTGQSAGDHQAQDDVALFRHAAVFRRVFVKTRGLQLVAELRLVEHDPHDDCHHDSQRDCKADVLVLVEQRAEAERRQHSRGVGIGQDLGIGAGVLFYERKEHIGQIQHDPVEHDAGNDLVDVAVGLEKARDPGQQRAAEDRRQHTRQPAPAEAQRRIQAQRRADAVLTGSADVEQADLIGEQDRQRAHQKRSRLDERVAQIFDLGGLAVIRPEVLDDRQDRVARAVGIDQQQDEIAEEQAQHDAQQRRDQRLHGAVFQKILFHAFTSSLLAPAM